MASHKKDNSAVGYGRPPIEHRFKKGQSGNPSGRPRQAKTRKSEAQVLQEILAEKVQVTVNGKKRLLSPEELVLRKYVSNLVSSGRFYDLEGLKEHFRIKD